MKISDFATRLWSMGSPKDPLQIGTTLGREDQAAVNQRQLITNTEIPIEILNQVMLEGSSQGIYCGLRKSIKLSPIPEELCENNGLEKGTLVPHLEWNGLHLYFHPVTGERIHTTEQTAIAARTRITQGKLRGWAAAH
jgi:hypothetical protein